MVAVGPQQRCRRQVVAGPTAAQPRCAADVEICAFPDLKQQPRGVIRGCDSKKQTCELPAADAVAHVEQGVAGRVPRECAQIEPSFLECVV
jgi:hypothetical protein